ncbi:MAG: hypothetical protein ACPG3S_07050 [Schleiferiaceae bacterium]
MREQLELTAILICIALVSGAMFLFPVEKKVAERKAFLELWWSAKDSLPINRVDSTHIYSLPISEATKRSLWFRRKRNWPFKDLEELYANRYLREDSLFFALGTIDFSVQVARASETTATGASIKRPLPSRQWTAVDVNTCDSAALDALPGIGPGMVGILFRYRTRYGFIADMDHFKSNTYYGERWQQEWATLLTIDSVPPPKLSLEHSTFEELMHFPELNYEQTKRICFYRERFTVPTWKEIEEWEEFSGADTTFLQLYISRN